MTTRIATLAIAALLLFMATSVTPSLPNATAALGPPAQTSHIRVHSTLTPGQAIISWQTVDGVSDYRVAYVNMHTFDALRRANPAADWRQTVRFSEIASTAAETRSRRAARTIEHLVPGAPYAFTVMTSNDNTWDTGTTSGSFHWPHPPVWTHHQVPAPPTPAQPQPTPTRPEPTAPAVTPTPSPTRGMSRPEPTQQQYDEAVQYMLKLINEARSDAGAPPVTLGDNPSAQQHADDMQSECFNSHWGSDGLKPYMRYTLGGGHQATAENVSHAGSCFRLSSVLVDARQMVDIHMHGLMRSPGHRATILDPDHAKVSIGIKLGPRTEQIVQIFEHDHVTFTAPPTITGTTLAASGEAHVPTRANEDIQLRVRITRHRPPHDLTDRQLASTYSYGEDTPVAVIDIPSDTTMLPDEATFIRLAIPHSLYPDPYQAPARPLLTSHTETSQLRRAAIAASSNPSVRRTSAFIIDPARRNVALSGTRFSFKVDIEHVLDEFGPGVYTIVIYASSPSTPNPRDISAYSIFHQVEPPTNGAD